jgi:hypothetical protein
MAPSMSERRVTMCVSLRFNHAKPAVCSRVARRAQAAAPAEGFLAEGILSRCKEKVAASPGERAMRRR